ncbi:MAG: choice-of-anchor J domain-containing protein, partial [Bacteroidales bacterium]|nr:choice-of-anchor J domain-containing protein [Bacteroidales bacterium]
MKKIYLLSFSIAFVAISVAFAPLKAQNLVVNGDFENWTAGTADNWLADGGAITIMQNTTTVESGASSCEVTWTSQDNQYLTSDPFVVTAGVEINANFWVYDNDLAGRARLCIIYEGADNYYGNYSEDMAEWQQITYTDLVPDGATSATFQVRFYDISAEWDGDATVIVDNVVFEGNTTVYPEPSNYPSDFVAAASGLSIDLDWTESTGAQLPTGYLLLGEKVSGSFEVPVDGVPVATDLDWSDGKVAVNVGYDIGGYAFEGLETSATYYFTIYPYTNGGTAIDYKTDGTAPLAEATTANISTISHEGFDSGLGVWSQYSVTGDQVWEWANYGNPPGCAKGNGYSGAAVENEDWLISPSLDLTGYINLTFGFDHARNYASNDGLYVMISTDYTGSGDPTLATWSDLTASFTFPDPGSWTFISAGTADISAYATTSTYIAFVYNSTDVEASTWEVDNADVLGVINTGIDKVSTTTLRVYPNPATDFIQVVSNENATMEIVNLMGQKVLSQPVVTGSNTVSVNELKSGV